jgi:hypothetical protein
MRKKCIPGLICVENMTLFLLLFCVLLILFFFYNFNINRPENVVVVSHPMNVPPPAVIGPLQTISTRSVDPFNDPYSPPLKTNDLFYPNLLGGWGRGCGGNCGGDIRPTPRIPINMETNGYSCQYSQIGILTRKDGKDDLIIPLMGRRIINGRDKWQYYTISNNGNMNTKLPIRFKGKNATSDVGCDEIYENDTLYVEGYKDKFVATIYENEKISYIPVI